MLRYAWVFFFLFTLWIFTFGTGFGQPPVLRVNAERLQHLRRMEQKAIATNDSLLLAEAYYWYGDLYHSTADNITSKRYYLKALRILEPRGNSFKLGWAYLQLGVSLNVHADSKEDIRYAYRALEVFERIHSLKGAADAGCHGQWTRIRRHPRTTRADR